MQEQVQLEKSRFQLSPPSGNEGHAKRSQGSASHEPASSTGASSKSLGCHAHPEATNIDTASSDLFNMITSYHDFAVGDNYVKLKRDRR